MALQESEEQQEQSNNLLTPSVTCHTLTCSALVHDTKPNLN